MDNDKFSKMHSPSFFYNGEKTTIQAGDNVKCCGNNTYSISRNGGSVRFSNTSTEPADDKFIISNIFDFLEYTGAATGLKILRCETSPGMWKFSK